MKEIFDAINSYGLSVVIAGAFIYICFKCVDAILKRRKDKQTAELEAERDKREYERYEAFTKQILDIVQHGPNHTVAEQEEHRRVQQLIQEQLDKLVRDGASRAYFFTFHNGGRDILGNGLMKMSMVAESIGSNKPIMPHYQAMPRALFPIVYNRLDEEGAYFVEDRNNIAQSDPMTYQFLLEHEAKAVLFRAVRRQDGLLVGFVGVEYNSDVPDLHKAKVNLDKKLNRIVGILLGADKEFSTNS